MLADLDLLLIAVFCAADDLLPKRAGQRQTDLIDAEVVTLAVAQAIMGIPSDGRFLAVAETARATCSRSCRTARLLQRRAAARRTRSRR